MFNLLRFLLAGFGLPVVAQLLQHQTQKISDKVSIFTFVARKRKDLIRTATVAVFAIVFTASGIVLTAFGYALQTDYRFEGAISASLIVAMSTLLVGLVMGAYAWSNAKKMEVELADYLQTKHETPSLLTTIFHTLVNAFQHSAESSKTRSSNSQYVPNPEHEEDHRKTLN